MTLPEQLQPPTVLHPLQRADIFSLRMPLSLIHQFREHFAPHCLPVLFLLFPHQSLEKNPLTPSFPASFFPRCHEVFPTFKMPPNAVHSQPPLSWSRSATIAIITFPPQLPQTLPDSSRGALLYFQPSALRGGAFFWVWSTLCRHDPQPVILPQRGGGFLCAQRNKQLRVKWCWTWY